MQGWEGRVLRRFAWRLGLSVAALVFFFGWFAPAVDAAYIHDVRTPVTATLPYDCGGYDLGHISCNADWYLDGEMQAGWVARKHSGTAGEVIDAAVVDDDFVYQDFGVSIVDRVALAGGLALPLVVPLALLARRRLVTRRGQRPALRTVVLSPLITLGGVAVGTGAVLFAVTLDLRDPVQARHGGLLAGAGAVLLLAGVPIWWPMIREVRAARTARVQAAARAAAAARVAGTRPPVPAGPPSMWWKNATAVSQVLSDAVGLAARELPPGEPLTTGRLLSAIARMDVSGDWQRIWLLVGDPHRTGLATAPDASDPAPGPRYNLLTPPTWGGTRLSTRLVQALWLADRIGGTYNLRPVPSGVVALALLAHRRNGATEALLSQGAATHAQLLRTIQTDILKTTLTNLGALVPAARF
jgi:hypothetical protein